MERMVRVDIPLAEIKIFRDYSPKPKVFILEKNSTIALNSEISNIFLVSESSSKQLFIYDGSGDLDLSHCLKKYDFSDLALCELDFYLQNKKIRSKVRQKEREKILDFCEVSNLNLEKDKFYLNPPHFEDIWRKLLSTGEIKAPKFIRL